MYYFIAAAEQGSFRKAGSVLGVSQPAISRSIKDLEDKIGVSLFHRKTNGVLLTHAGDQFLQGARRGLEIIHESASNLSKIGVGDDGSLKVMFSTSIASGFLLELLRIFGQKHSRVRIELINGDPAAHIASIRQLRLDVAFVGGETSWSGCEAEPLWSEHVFAVLPFGHKLANKAQLEWADLDGERFIVSGATPGPEIRNYLIKRLSDHGSHPLIQIQWVGADNLLSLVALGRELTLTTEATTATQVPGVIYRPIIGENLPFSVVWSSRNDNPALRRFIGLARSLAKSYASNLKYS
ncbi:LysR family transcriptional regulator [Paenirhodobacter populi]|uniref:LysR substrate-binding domain-containing protein n=1 Tax=Paenirhodobacter populi TaxID=2306993 RepID=UPI001F4D7E96|nr:LysR family transcriptional regulator [Sinirhodobacter populi]